MEVYIIKGKYEGVNIVHKLNKLIGTYDVPDLNNLENPSFYNNDDVNILVFDYTPIIQGNILIKYPGKKWEKLKMNSKLFNYIKKQITYKSPHTSKRSNWISSIRVSSINTIKV